MRRCQKCGTIAAEEATRCGICGGDLFAIQSESLQDAVANEGKDLAKEKKKMEQEELVHEQTAGRRSLVFYGMLVGLIVVGIILTTLRSDTLNVAGIAFILLGLLLVAFGVLGRGPRSRRGFETRIRP